MTEIEKELWELRQRCATVETVCAVLIAKLALGTPKPPEAVQQTIAELQGLAIGVASNITKRSGETTEAVTASMERICSMAEDVLVER